MVNQLNGLTKIKYKIFEKLIYSKIKKTLGGRLKFTFSASGRLPKELCEAFLSMGIRIYEGYGSTETLNTVNLNRPEKILPGSIGCLCTGVKGKLGEDNEWLVKGDNLFKKYWNKPELTKEAFTDEGFYKTGDIVEFLDDGYINIKDRKKGLIVLDTGKNVASAKIESFFALSDYIDTVIPFGTDKKYITAIVIPNFDSILNYLKASNINTDGYKIEFEDDICIRIDKNLLDNKEVKSLIESEIENTNSKLESYENIKKYFVSSRRLSEKTGELTPTLKVKRNIVEKIFKEKINAMYAE